MKYRVQWKIDIDRDQAATPAEAAEAALEMQRDPGTIAGVYHVRDTETGETWEIDLTFGTQTQTGTGSRRKA